MTSLMLTARGRTVALAVVTVAAVAATLVLRDGDDAPQSAHHAMPSVRYLDLPGPSAATAHRPAAVPAGPAVEPATALDALRAFFSAEADGRPDLSFLLTTGAGSRGDWIEDHADRLVPHTFTLESSTGNEFTLLVSHTPAIDPFDGFVPGTTRQVWRVVDTDGRFRVAVPAVSVDYVLPADAGAAPVAADWLRALEACDTAGAARLQVAPDLFGPSALAAGPCRRTGWRTGTTAPVQRRIDVESFAAAFGPDLGEWARLVPVEGPGGGFFAVVAPLGDAWRVLGITTGPEP